MRLIFALSALTTCLMCCSPAERSAVPRLPPEEVELRTADSLLNMLQYTRCQPHYRKADSLFAGNLERQFYCRRRLAQSYWANNGSAKAKAICRELLPQVRNLLGAQHPEVARILTILGNMEADLRTDRGFEASLQHYQSALHIFEANYPPNHPDVALAYGRFGIAHWLHDDYPAALRYYQRALSNMDTTLPDSKRAQIKLYSNMGLAYRSAGLYGKALDCFSTAYHYEATGTANTRLTDQLMEMAQTRVEMGDSEEALRLAERALAIENALGDSGVKMRCYIIETMGNAYLALQQYDSAVVAFQRCLTYWDRHEPDHAKGFTQDMESLGNALLLRGDAHAAIRCFEQSAQVSEQHYGTRNFNHAPVLKSLGKAYGSIGQYSRARRYLQAALAIAESKTGIYNPETGDIRYLLADLFFREGRYAQSLAAVGDAQQSYHTPPYPGAKQYVTDYIGLIRAKHLEGNVLVRRNTSFASPSSVRRNTSFDQRSGETGVSLYKAAIQLADSMRHTLTTHSNRLAVQKEVVEIAESALEALHNSSTQGSLDAESLADVFYFFEKSKVAAMQAAFQKINARSAVGIPETWAVEEETRKAKVRTALQNWYRCTDSTSVADRLQYQERYAHALSAADSFERALSQQFPKYHALKTASQLPDLAQAKHYAAARNCAVVSYFWGKTACYALIITSDTCRWLRLGASAELSQSIRELLGTVRSAPSMTTSDAAALAQMRQFCSSSHGLYQQIIAPLGLHGEVNLTIIPDGPLYYVPFEALLSRSANEAAIRALEYRNLPYLIQSCAVSLESSAQFLHPEPSAIQPVEYLGFAPDYSQSNLPPLAYNVAEVRSASALLGGRVLENGAASKSNFYRYAMQAGILHFASHAVVDARRNERSAFIFGDPTASPADNRLPWYELYDLHLKAQLAILSACNTNDGAWENGEGVASLSAAFRYAGCAAVLAGRWKVNDASSHQIVSVFLQHLKNGADKPNAYRRAACTYLTDCKSEQKCHPFYWAAFALSGNTDPLFEQNTAYSSVFWSKWGQVLLLVCVVGGCFLLWKRRAVKF